APIPAVEPSRWAVEGSERDVLVEGARGAEPWAVRGDHAGRREGSRGLPGGQGAGAVAGAVEHGGGSGAPRKAPGEGVKKGAGEARRGHGRPRPHVEPSRFLPARSARGRRSQARSRGAR